MSNLLQNLPATSSGQNSISAASSEMDYAALDYSNPPSIIWSEPSQLKSPHFPGNQVALPVIHQLRMYPLPSVRTEKAEHLAATRMENQTDPLEERAAHLANQGAKESHAVLARKVGVTAAVTDPTEM